MQDDIHEYLMIKGCAAVSTHGGKDQSERDHAVSAFKSCDGTGDVLIATDVAAKGLDFPDVQHVVNFDMPPEVTRHGRGRAKHLTARRQAAARGDHCHVVSLPAPYTRHAHARASLLCRAWLHGTMTLFFSLSLAAAFSRLFLRSFSG